MKKFFLNLFAITLIFSCAFSAPLAQIALIPKTGFVMDFYLEETEAISTLPKFIDEVATSGDPNEVAGLFLADVLELPVVQQPRDNPGFVSSKPDTVTQFGMVNQFGSVALLAHNDLAGEKFFDLEVDQILSLVFGNEDVTYYRIVEVLEYQALSPTSPYSSFVDLDDPEGKVISVTDLFYNIYAKADRLVLQTCIAEEGQSSWGRLFIIAVPVEPTPPASIM